MHVLIPCPECREEGGDTTPTRTIVSGKLVKETKKGTQFLLELSCGHPADVLTDADEKKAIMANLGYNVDEQTDEDDVG